MNNFDNKDDDFEIRDDELDMKDTEINEDDYEEDDEGEGGGKTEGTDLKMPAGKKEKDDGKVPPEKESEYEDVCFICRRPESKAGKMFKLPNNISVCNDCMHKTMDTVSQFDYQGMLGNTDWNKEIDKWSKGKGFPNISFVNLADLQGDGGIPNKQKLKKKKAKDKASPVLDIKSIPAPHKIKARLDEYVVGQEKAKKIISVAVYNHYKRVATGTMDEIEIEKSNILMIGPTGSGKTYLVKTLARLLDVPLAIADATSLTEAGYIGDDIESVVSKLLAAAENDVEKAEQGIIFIDEIDKIAKKRNANSRDVSGESVQQGMLKLLEGSEVEVPVGANSKNAMVPLTTVNTKNILFICGGAFDGIERKIAHRLNTHVVGFTGRAERSKIDSDNYLKYIAPQDLKSFGLIPEIIGRLPVLVHLDPLDRDALLKVLTEPKNAIIRQYEKLFAMDGVKLTFAPETLEFIVDKAIEYKLGARGLRTIVETVMMDPMYDTPSLKINELVITREFAEEKIKKAYIG